MPANTPARRRAWIVAITTVATLAAAATLLLPRLAGPPATPVADRLTPPATWQLVTDVVTAPSFLCLGGQPCPSVQRAWTTPNQPTADDIDALTEAAGWPATLDGTCTPEHPTDRTVCRATATVDGFAVELRVVTSTTTDGASIQLDVRPN
ncbi:hypothetical protein AB6N23_02735 [Cellulomonas sp. 179-A 9B4 NHS]|uniref:hypothetical protein n=1 Tax=Cellulomonas sp. 179-A 9B4 NHS TaxID=3142379 RepID=UPI0039A1120A